MIAEDEYYYTKKGHEELMRKYDDITKIITFPTFEDVKTLAPSEIEKTAFLSVAHPSQISKMFEEAMIFEIERLPNRHGILTTGQVKRGKKDYEVLSDKLNVKMEKSKNTMADYSGAEILHEEVRLVKEKIELRIPIKGWLFTGIPGAGKSFFAKCIAGELDYILVSLSLSSFMEKQDTVSALNAFFAFFEKTPGEYVIWIDEIEKSFEGEKSQRVMGELLTRINESSNVSEDTTFFIIATANNVTQISKKNPEFFRSGRFDLIIFLFNPIENDAFDIFSLYIAQAQESLRTFLLPNAIKAYIKRQSTTPINKIQGLAKKFIEEFGILLPSFGEIKEMGTKEWRDVCNHEDIKKALFAICEEDDFIFNINSFMQTASERYRGKDTIQKERFIYTPAEIENIVKVSFHNYYLIGNYQIDDKKLIEKHRPLQASSKDGVTDIIATATNFVII